MSYKGMVKGNIVKLEENLPYAHGQVVNVTIEPEAKNWPLALL